MILGTLGSPYLQKCIHITAGNEVPNIIILGTLGFSAIIEDGGPNIKLYWGPWDLHIIKFLVRG